MLHKNSSDWCNQWTAIADNKDLSVAVISSWHSTLQVAQHFTNKHHPDPACGVMTHADPMKQTHVTIMKATHGQGTCCMSTSGNDNLVPGFRLGRFQYLNNHTMQICDQARLTCLPISAAT